MFIKWLDRNFKAGIFEGVFKNMILWCDNHLSCNNCFNKRVKAQLGISPKDKAPMWSSEFYQILSLPYCENLGTPKGYPGKYKQLLQGTDGGPLK